VLGQLVLCDACACNRSTLTKYACCADEILQMRMSRLLGLITLILAEQEALELSLHLRPAHRHLLADPQRQLDVVRDWVLAMRHGGHGRQARIAKLRGELNTT